MPKLFDDRTVSIETYKTLVDRCARERLDYPIANGSPFHARILISKLFEIAERDVSLVSGRLTVTNPENVDVYGYSDVIEKGRAFIRDPGTRLNIVIQSGEIDKGWGNTFLQALVNFPERNGEITVVCPSKSEIDFAVPHFMVTDGEAYRLETAADAISRRDANAMTAIANFGDKRLAATLRRYFSDLLSFFEGSCVENFAPGRTI